MPAGAARIAQPAAHLFERGLRNGLQKAGFSTAAAVNPEKSNADKADTTVNPSLFAMSAPPAGLILAVQNTIRPTVARNAFGAALAAVAPPDKSGV